MNGKTYENEILYHYTDFQALDGILHDARLRVNNVLNMNDAAEMRYFMSRLCDAVAGRLENEGDSGKAGQVRALFAGALKIRRMRRAFRSTGTTRHSGSVTGIAEGAYALRFRESIYRKWHRGHCRFRLFFIRKI